MKKNLRLLSLAGLILLTTYTAQSQNDRFAYSVTDFQQNSAGWNVLRKLNLETGEFSQVLLNGTDGSQVVFDAATKKQFKATADPKYGNYLQSAFSTGVAAIAYDKRHDRLYYTPMFIDQLRYIDLKTMTVFYVTDQSFTTKGNMNQNEGNVVTRMVIGADGNGYALTNDGNTFLRFTTTGKKTKITSLGALTDDAGNKDVSIHVRNSFGGDMIADDDGNLYIVSAFNHIFKVNIESRVAKYITTLSGLPKNYSTNGMAVDADGKILVSSANSSAMYFKVDPDTWEVSPYTASNGFYRSSDLANGNILNTKKNTAIATIARDESMLSNKIQLYPNPVSHNTFAIQFSNLQAGNYTIQLTDVAGRHIVHRKVNVGGSDQSETVNINPAAARGVYLVKVIDQKSKSVFIKKVVVQ